MLESPARPQFEVLPRVALVPRPLPSSSIKSCSSIPNDSSAGSSWPSLKVPKPPEIDNTDSSLTVVPPPPGFVVSTSNSTLPVTVKPLSVLLVNLITTSLSVWKLSPSLAVTSAACCVYFHSNPPVTDTSATA